MVDVIIYLPSLGSGVSVRSEDMEKDAKRVSMENGYSSLYEFYNIYYYFYTFLYLFAGVHYR